jgi:hypothetical protein
MFKQELADLLTGASQTVVDEMFTDEDVLTSEKYYPEGFAFLADLQAKGIEPKLEVFFGGEGKGDNYYKIWSFTKAGETLYVKLDGYYASYNGATYDNMSFVEPHPKTVVVYRKAESVERFKPL